MSSVFNTMIYSAATESTNASEELKDIMFQTFFIFIIYIPGWFVPIASSVSHRPIPTVQHGRITLQVMALSIQKYT